MSTYYDAFEHSPVPEPGPDAVAPDIFRGIYGMPMFVTIPTTDIDVSADFWQRALGFVDLFSIPGRMVHLRRWAFQDVLLVATDEETPAPPASSVTFAAVLDQVDGIAEACKELRPGSTQGPRHTPWNTVDVEVVTPENARVLMSAAKPYDPESQSAKDLADVGITGPEA
ncbi:VOC family protein [Georgenia sp. Z1344]|uniref:VOC family protein n=1 Tax=Georgenia sp. Z1344 TaxID=3416706 RepID=UPI003CF64EE1